MKTVAIDTLKLAQELKEKAHLTDEQAEGFASAIAETLHDDLATKAELREVELQLNAKIESAKSEIIKWMVATIGFQVLIIFGALIAFARVAHR
jgi:hypothetical protein